MTTDTSELGLERLIVAAMTGVAPAGGGVAETPATYGERRWVEGNPHDYDREHAIDLVQLTAFLQATQPEVAEALDLANDGPPQQTFLARLQGEITRRGTIDVLRAGLKHRQYNLDLFYGTPSPGNPTAAEHFALNRFTITRQLRYSKDETQLALDLVTFINGLPVFTFELKNNLTKQTVADAVQQYQRDRSPRELLFQLGRCVAHFALDDQEVRFCTHLTGKDSWFLPFNLGWNDGAGNPPNPNGIKTDYLWRRILTPSGLTNILERYTQVVEQRDDKTGKKRRVQIFPRYHQLDVVRKLLEHASEHGAGQRYLVQHSAGSGKSNSIAWLAHQLVGLEHDGAPVFDSVVVVTDRRILDRQIRDTIKQFAQVGATLGHAERSGDLRRFLEDGKKIIITTVQKFPFVLDDIGTAHAGRNFAIIIDEAHSSQGGKATGAMSQALAGVATDDDETTEDSINRLMESRKMLPNASYFAFTATPKNKTLEIFGERSDEAGETKHRPFHNYSMKQAIQEGFILDVLKHYTPVNSYYRLVKTVEADPEFDTKRAHRKLRRYVESNDHAIRLKAEIMVDHFHEQVSGLNKIGGEARAMVVTSGVERAIQYFHQIRSYLQERKSPYEAIVAFSGEHEYHGSTVTEASLNGFPSNAIPDKIQEHPYRFLVVADKFQTGYDEPLLHTMYVDKPLSGIKAVQTLSRLNRAHPKKHDTFILDFLNDSDGIEFAFSDYYRTTILSGETDPNKLHDLTAALEDAEVYSDDQVDGLVELYLSGADVEQLHPILDACVARYKDDLDEDGQVGIQGERQGLHAHLRLPLLDPAVHERGVGEAVHLPRLPDPEAPRPAGGRPLERHPRNDRHGQLPRREAGRGRDPARGLRRRDRSGADECVAAASPSQNSTCSRTSSRSSTKNSEDIAWDDVDRVRRMITEEIPDRVAADPAYQNAKANSDEQNARIEHNKALGRVILTLMKDDTQLFKQFSDNDQFKRWIGEKVFALTYS